MPNFMMNFLKNNNIGFYVSSFLCLLIVLGSVVSCTDKNETFGSGMIPPAQQMGSAIDSTIGVNTYISVTEADSLDTNILGYVRPFMGSYIDPLVGRTDVQVFVNFSPIGFQHEVEFNYFGENPVIDSLRYAIDFSKAIGDTTKAVLIDVYEVKDYVFKQKVPYYSTFDMTPYIDEGNPLFTIEQKGAGIAYGRIPDEFAKRLLDTRKGEENIYWNDTIFHAKFPGFYFKVRTPATSGEGQMFQFDFLTNSVMTLFYGNDESPDTASLEQRLLFYRDSEIGALTYDYISFSTIQHDYSLSDPSKDGVIVADIDSKEPSEYLYIQGLAGLMGELEIDSLALGKLKQKVKDLGYANIALHRADLKVKMVNPSAVEYNDIGKSFPALGIYYDMTSYDFLQEYQPILAAIGGGYKTTLGGGVNRSTGVYTFDITSYVQRLLTGRETRYETELQTAWGYRNDLARSWVYGTKSKFPPKLVLTYTMIK